MQECATEGERRRVRIRTSQACEGRRDEQTEEDQGEARRRPGKYRDSHRWLSAAHRLASGQ